MQGGGRRFDPDQLHQSGAARARVTGGSGFFKDVERSGMRGALAGSQPAADLNDPKTFIDN